MITRSYITALAAAVVWLAVVKGLDGRYVKNNEGRIKDYILNHPNYSVTDRPVLDSEDTVDVWMSMGINAMLHLSERDQAITTASWLTMRWRDPRLQWNSSEFGGVDFLNVLNTEIWIPKIFISNALDYGTLTLVSPDRGSIILASDGVASLGTPIVLSTQCPVYIKYFPFDTQACMFNFIPENFVEERIRLFTEDAPDKSEIGSREWQLLELTNTRYTVTYQFARSIPEANSSVGLFCLYLQRNPSHYIRTLWIPSSILCLMAFVTFLAPPDCGERISLGVSMVLGLTVFQLLITDILPTSGNDPPILSTYLTLNFIMACLAIPLSLMNINTAYGDSRIFFLKYPFTRNVFLEYLPRLAGIPSYSKRIMFLDKDVKPVEKNGPQAEECNQEEGKQRTAIRTFTAMEDEIRPAEKTRFELRTVALVMDRLVVTLFLVAFVVLLTVTVLQFQQNPGVPDDVRARCG